MSANTIIGGDTIVTVPESTVAALESLHVRVTGYGSAQLSTDSSGDLLAQFPITGGYAGPYDTILHEGSGLRFADAHGSIRVSDFRIDTQTDIVYGDVHLTEGSTTINESNVDLFAIGAGDALTFTSDAISAVNAALGSSLTTAVAVGTAAPAPILNPLPAYIEESSVIRGLFHDYGYTGGEEPIIGGRTVVSLTSLSTLQSLGVSVSGLGSAIVRTHIANPVAIFGINGGTETSGGDVILHQGSGLELKDSAGTVDIKNLVVDTIHSVVDASVSLDGKFAHDIAVFNIGSGGALSLTSGAASALDATLNLGSALSSSTVIGNAAPHPVALTTLEAGLFGSFS